MIKSITGVATRFFRNNKLIAFTSIIGVMISISLIITMIVFVSNAKQSLVQEVEKMYGKMDLSVGYNPEQNRVIDKDLSNTISSQEGVINTSEVFLTHYIVDQVSESYYTAGVENDELAKSRYHFTQNIQMDEVSLNEGFAKVLNVTIGDPVLIEGHQYMVKELLPDLEAAGQVTDILLLNRETIAKLEFEKTGIAKQSDYMMLEVSESTNVYTLAQNIQNIDSELRVDIAVEDEFFKSNLDSLYQFMIGLSILVILITALFIISNFELFLYKYRHELAVMRSIGASRWQVFRIVLLQSAFINLLGGIFALTFSFLTYNYLQKGFEKVFSLAIGALHFEFGTAIIVTLICMASIQFFMLIPAYRSSRLLPITIMQENEAIDFSYKILRKKVGFTVLGVSIFFVLIGFTLPNSGFFIISGSIGFLLSSISLVPLYLATMLGSILPIVRHLFGNISFVSLKNTLPQVRKNTFIVLIISAMMIIVVFGSTFIQTIQKSDESYIKEQYETEIVMTNRLVDTSPINAIELRHAVENLASVESISTQSRQDIGEINMADGITWFDYSFADIAAMSEQGLIQTAEKVGEKGVIVKEDFAQEHGLNIGDTLPISIQYEIDQMTFYTQYLQDGEVVIADIVSSFPYPNVSDMLIDWETTAVDTSFKTFEKAHIEVLDSDLALAELEGLKEIYPEIQVNSLEQSLQQSKEMAMQRWVIFIVVLVVILVSVMFGVVNTLINNINSKRKEFAVLRVIYMNGKNIIQAIMTQITAYILFGILLGISLGLIFTYLLGQFDSGVALSFNWTLILIMSLTTFIIAYIVLIPFADRIGNLRISEELMQDNK